MCKEQGGQKVDDAFATTTGETTLTAGLLASDKVMPPLPGSPSAPEGKVPGGIPTAAQVEEIPDEDDAVCETSAVRGVSATPCPTVAAFVQTTTPLAIKYTSGDQVLTRNHHT
jgi:hypothetical protein